MIRQLDALTRVIPVRYAVDRELCLHYAKQFTQLRAAGTPIGAHDLWIACHALALDATLLMNNTANSSASLASSWRIGQARDASGHGAVSILQKRCR